MRGLTPYLLGGAHVGDEESLLILGYSVPPAVRDEDLLVTRVLLVDLAPVPLHALEIHGFPAVDLINRAPLNNCQRRRHDDSGPFTRDALQAATDSMGSPTCSLSRTLRTASWRGTSNV